LPINWRGLHGGRATHLHTRIHIRIHAHIHTHIYPLVHTHTHTYIPTRETSHTHTHIYPHVRPHTQLHIHTCRFPSPLLLRTPAHLWHPSSSPAALKPAFNDS